MAQHEVVEETVVERTVKPVGKLLNDNDSGVDQLGYLVYAQALASLLHGCTPPITVGIFGPWGIGKTFLLKHVQGLLHKYEQQEVYDEANAKHETSCVRRRRTAATEEVDGSSKDLINTKPRNKTHRTNMRRACTIHSLPIVAFLLIITLFAVLFVLVIRPTKQSISQPPQLEPPPVGVNDTGRSSGKVASGTSLLSIPEIGNLTDDSEAESPSTTAATTTDETEVISGNVRLYLILLLVALTGIVFTVFCCCVAKTNSKSWKQFFDNFKLVFYAAFTRLPSVAVSHTNEWMEADNPYLVTHFNDDRAELRLFDPGDEENINGSYISSRKVRRMPSKYIFVNYHAWQYAGSDTLWAGIVTNLSEAIENEFGAVCTRLFRMLQVERPSKSGPIEIRKKGDPRAFYVHFNFSADSKLNSAKRRDRIVLIMKEYGVVSQCSLYQGAWWYVRFSCDKEADFAERALKLEDFEISRKRPTIIQIQSESSVVKEEPVSLEELNSGGRSKLLTHGLGLSGDGCDKKSPLKSCDIPRRKSYQGAGRYAGDRRSQGEISNITTEPMDQRNDCCCNFGCCRCCAHFRRHPKTVCCGCPFLYCYILFFVAAVMFPVTIMILADYLELGVMKSTRTIPLEVQIFSWLPAMAGVFIVVLRFCWAMCNSQTERIRKALAGTKGSMGKALGFMNGVKQEVMIMTQLINCVRFTHGVNYKIVITIDDLDRCPYDKVKSVLEAVSILLSDRSSPFLCLIAVDSRVAVKCIEQDMGEVLLQAHLTGHEYLKKIINLPFCLPEVANNAKRKYFGGVMDSADQTQVERVAVAKSLIKQRDEDYVDAVVTDNVDPGEELPTTQGGDDTTHVDGKGGAEPNGSTQYEPLKAPPDEKRFSEFLFQCREILHGVGPEGRFLHQHMCGNPRNMKRIFNVLSLTTHLMKYIEERRIRLEYLAMHSQNAQKRQRRKHLRHTSIVNSDLRPQTSAVVKLGQKPQDAIDLVKWIVAADQWPYRISYILQVVEDSDQRRGAELDEPEIKSDCTLSTVYEKYVEPEIAQDTSACSMLTLDRDPAVLRSFLRGSITLTRQRVSCLFPVTLNLDLSLRNGISRQRAGVKSSEVAATPTQDKVKTKTSAGYCSNDEGSESE